MNGKHLLELVLVFMQENGELCAHFPFVSTIFVHDCSSYHKQKALSYLSCSAIAMTTELFFSLNAASRMLSFVLFNVTSDLAFDSSNVTTGAWPLMAARSKAVFYKAGMEIQM